MAVEREDRVLILKRKIMGPRGSHGFKHGTFYDIFIEGKKASVGFVGYESAGYLKVFIKPQHRRKGIAIQAEDQLAKQEGFEMWVTDINRDNLNSVVAHTKGGFVPAGDDFYIKEY